MPTQSTQAMIALPLIVTEPPVPLGLFVRVS
jgi:hypothetical protein